MLRLSCRVVDYVVVTPHSHKHTRIYLHKCKFRNRVMTFGLNNGRSKTGVVNTSTTPKTFNTFYKLLSSAVIQKCFQFLFSSII